MHEITRKKREAWWSLVGHSDVKKATKDATNSDAWGPTVAQLKGLTAACYVTEDRAEVMHNLWKRIDEREAKKWTKVAKTLVVLEYVSLHGPEDVVTELRSGAFRLRELRKFEFVDSTGEDKGESVRQKAENLLALIKDDRKFKEARERAKRTSERITSASTTNPQHMATPPSSTKIPAGSSMAAGIVRDVNAPSPVAPSQPSGNTEGKLTDEQIARKLQEQFDAEALAAGIRASSRPTSAPPAPAPEPTPAPPAAAAPQPVMVDGVELPGVDMEEQRRMLDTFRSAKSQQPESTAAPVAPDASVPPPAAAVESPLFDPRASETAPAAGAGGNANMLFFSPESEQKNTLSVDDLFGAPVPQVPPPAAATAPPPAAVPSQPSLDDFFGAPMPQQQQQQQQVTGAGGFAAPTAQTVPPQQPAAKDDFEARMMDEFNAFSTTNSRSTSPALRPGAHTQMSMGQMAAMRTSPPPMAPSQAQAQSQPPQGGPVPFSHVQNIPMPQPTNRMGYYSSP
eukprot:TRINITY_DN437_c0_g2_i1.p1 TRINITY_DN437_c0_g2~~TRINITY_DN437_c0_g2_i1.p1  ORF type:complete len:511 (+),score=154.20 TRINITY_DN437_c0_g2_i1:66-1598(+)